MVYNRVLAWDAVALVDGARWQSKTCENSLLVLLRRSLKVLIPQQSDLRTGEGVGPHAQLRSINSLKQMFESLI